MMKFIWSRQGVGLQKAVGCLCGAALMFACESKNKEEIAPSNASAAVPVAELTTFLSTSTGVESGSIVYDEAKKTFVLDGDVMITAADAQERLAASKGRTTQGEQWRWNYLVSNTYVTNIDYFIQADVPADWKAATRASITNWNAVNGTKLFLREVTSSGAADVIVNLGYADENWIARAYLPYSNGRPGNTVTINTKYNYLSASYKEFTMTHEMGHIHGLTHTNQTQGVFINGTPTTDSKSVMNATVLPWEGFTAGDIKAVQTIYPE